MSNHHSIPSRGAGTQGLCWRKTSVRMTRDTSSRALMMDRRCCFVSQGWKKNFRKRSEKQAEYRLPQGTVLSRHSFDLCLRYFYPCQKYLCNDLIPFVRIYNFNYIAMISCASTYKVHKISKIVIICQNLGQFVILKGRAFR